MIILTFTFLLVALTVYTVFGGADFGAGMLESTLWRHPVLRQRLQTTLAPIWEANHVWLIAIVVILFVGFPAAYAGISKALFVPLSLALLGIIIRGVFFTFRKYDPAPGPWSERLYSLLFRVSSGLTPLMFGFIVSALLRPLPHGVTNGDGRFASLYILPWLTVHGLLCGVFIYALFGYLSAVFFFGELTDAAERGVLRRRIVWFFLATFVAGGVVLVTGAALQVVDVRRTFTVVQLVAQLLAFVAIPILWRAMCRGHIWRMRVAAGIQVVCILTGWWSTQAPVLLRYSDGTVLTMYNSAAPAVTLFWLNIGLVLVLIAVVPMLVLLYRVFRTQLP